MWLQPLGPKEGGQTGLWNRILNALGMGVVIVHLGPSVLSATGGGQAAYNVDLRNALQFLTAHKEVLCSMGIISDAELSKPLFSPEQVVRFIERLYKMYFSEKEKLKQLNFYWMIKRSPALLAYAPVLADPGRRCWRVCPFTRNLSTISSRNDRFLDPHPHSCARGIGVGHPGQQRTGMAGMDAVHDQHPCA